jgi:hypothetical protein
MSSSKEVSHSGETNKGTGTPLYKNVDVHRYINLMIAVKTS